MSLPIYKLSLKRRLRDRFLKIATMVLALTAVAPLMLVFAFVFKLGIGHFNLDFFMHTPATVGSGLASGMFNSIVGSIEVVILSALLAAPFGILCGIYLAEYRLDRFASTLRLILDLLSATPSIVVGLFAYTMIVLPMRGFSAFAGAGALAFLMLPVIARTSEEILKLNTRELKEAGLALGLRKWRVIVFILFRGSFSGILTGVLLAIARCAGETAPLLFTAFNNSFVSHSIFQPTSTLPVQIYTFAISPFKEQQDLAWTGALVLLASVFFTNLFTRMFFSNRLKGVFNK